MVEKFILAVLTSTPKHARKNRVFHCFSFAFFNFIFIWLDLFSLVEMSAFMPSVRCSKAMLSVKPTTTETFQRSLNNDIMGACD